MARLGRTFPVRPVYRRGIAIPQHVNLLTCTDTLNDTSWTIAAASVATDGTAGPFGDANEAWLVKENSAPTTVHAEQHAVTLASAGVNYAVSVYAKLGSGSRFLWVRLNNKGGVAEDAIFDLTDGSINTQHLCTATSTSEGGGWYRCSIVADSGSGASAPNVIFGLANPTTVYTGDGASGIYLARPQVEIGALSAYVAVPCAAGATATIALTDAADSAAIAAKNTAVATIASTDAADSCAAAVKNTAVVTLGITDAADSVAVAAKNTAVATIAATESADSVAIASSSAVVVTLGITDAADTADAEVSSPVIVTLGITDAADSADAEVHTTVIATLAISDAADASDIESQAQGVSAELIAIDAADSCDAEVVNSVTVTLGISDGADAVSIAATNTAVATIAATDAADSVDVEVGGMTAASINPVDAADSCVIGVAGAATAEAGGKLRLPYFEPAWSTLRPQHVRHLVSHVSIYLSIRSTITNERVMRSRVAFPLEARSAQSVYRMARSSAALGFQPRAISTVACGVAVRSAAGIGIAPRSSIVGAICRDSRAGLTFSVLSKQRAMTAHRSAVPLFTSTHSYFANKQFAVMHSRASLFDAINSTVECATKVSRVAEIDRRDIDLVLLLAA